MSILILNRGGASGGLTAIIRVNGLREADTVTASKDGVIKNGVWNTTENRHEISGIKDTGVWTVTATNGEKTRTKDVLIEVIGLYEINMRYFIEVVTDFATKDPSWTEYGGTLNYGNGVYVNKGETKGTMPYGNIVAKYVDIPCYVETFDFSFVGNSNANGNTTMYGYYVQLLDDNETVLLWLYVEDWWSGSNKQVSMIKSYGNKEFNPFYEVTTYNAVDVAWRMVYDGSKIDYYMNNSLKATYDCDMPNAVTKVRIGFSAQPDASIPMAQSRIKNLKLLAL